MYMRSFIIGLTVETPLMNPALQGLITLFVPHIFRILLVRIPVHAFRQKEGACRGATDDERTRAA